jgi:hypothetical protein
MGACRGSRSWWPACSRLTADYAVDAKAGYLLDLLRHAQPLSRAPGDDGVGQDVTRRLIKRSRQLRLA